MINLTTTEREEFKAQIAEMEAQVKALRTQLGFSRNLAQALRCVNEKGRVDFEPGRRNLVVVWHSKDGLVDYGFYPEDLRSCPALELRRPLERRVPTYRYFSLDDAFENKVFHLFRRYAFRSHDQWPVTGVELLHYHEEGDV